MGGFPLHALWDWDGQNMNRLSVKRGSDGTASHPLPWGWGGSTESGRSPENDGWSLCLAESSVDEGLTLNNAH